MTWNREELERKHKAKTLCALETMKSPNVYINFCIKFSSYFSRALLLQLSILIIIIINQSINQSTEDELFFPKKIVIDKQRMILWHEKRKKERKTGTANSNPKESRQILSSSLSEIYRNTLG
jgi:hypothetical protein